MTTLWAADQEHGPQHARIREHAPRTLCDAVAVPLRHTYPGRGRCGECVAMVAARRDTKRVA